MDCIEDSLPREESLVPGEMEIPVMATVVTMTSRSLVSSGPYLRTRHDATAAPVLLNTNPLRERAHEALWATGYASLRNLTVLVDDGLIVLQGQVSSYYLKQMAQAALLRLEGDLQVVNEIRVKSNDPSRSD